jgi:hypothetical protein
LQQVQVCRHQADHLLQGSLNQQPALQLKQGLTQQQQQHRVESE